MASVWAELRRRNVVKVAVAYAIVGWLLVEVASVVLPTFKAPEWIMQVFTFLVIVGFPLALILAWAFELTPEGIKREKDVDRSQSITHVTGRNIDYIIIAALVLALGFFAFDKFVLGPSRDAELVQSTTEAVTEQVTESVKSEIPDKSIAVLPFVNMSSDPEQEYFSDGLAEEILIVLARIPDLTVAPRASAFAYKGDNRSISQIADELRVNLVLAGSVRKAGNRVRITAELIDAGNNKQLWSKIFERELNDVFAIQEEIGKAIGHSLEIRLADNRGNTISIAGTNNVEAHNAYLKGRYLLHKRGNENVRRAIENFQQATELDPDFAEAHASLGIAKALGWGQRDKEGATLSAKRALELDRSLPMAWVAAGQAARQQFRFEDAEQALREALSLGPNNAEAAHLLASLLDNNGQLEEALQLGLQAVSLDPATAIYRTYLGIYHMGAGRVAEGMAHLDEAMEINMAVYGYPLRWKAVTGDSEGALAILAKRITESEMPVGEEAWHRAFILVAAGRIEEARTVIAAIEQSNLIGLDVIVLAYLGDIDTANRAIEASFAEGYSMRSVRYLTRFMPDSPIRQTRYNELRASVGLPGIDDE